MRISSSAMSKLRYCKRAGKNGRPCLVCDARNIYIPKALPLTVFLFVGRYRNPYTDQALFKNRSVANVSVIPYRGKILVTKEDSLAYAMDPRTLETFGEYDFEGQWESKTFTAHPKYDPLTRELVAFGYEAKGLMSDDNYYGSLDQHGRLSEQVWFKAPYCGFQHEMAITENYVGSVLRTRALMLWTV